MNNACPVIPVPHNEPVLSYAPGSAEKKRLKEELERQYAQVVDIPVIIGGEEIRTGAALPVTCPHEHGHILAHCHQAGEAEIKKAIQSAAAAKKSWETTPWNQRAAVFLKMAELLSGKYRFILNAATMLNQSKTPYQAEIDSTCEAADFFRFNAKYMEAIYSEQPESSAGVWNRLEYRPLEGFVLAVTPFNFTSIAANLPTAPAMMGNTVVWKPATTALLSGYYLMQLYKEAGLPDGVINFAPTSGALISKLVVPHKDLAGIHFTGSTKVFHALWQGVAQNIASYRSFPRLVGETGGKDFIFAHESADAAELVTALVRGAFEYQGQKCSACSRAYIPNTLWPQLEARLKETIARIATGDVRKFSNFMGAVIDKKSFDDTMAYIERAKKSNDARIVAGGTGDASKGWFIEPTVIEAKTPRYETMCDELFAPVLTVYVYDAAKLDEALALVDTTSPYALTGAVFARDRLTIERLERALVNSAGNFYINDKPTGAVVGQQPFGGARGSGTNDKAGSYLNLLRWASPRTIKETFTPAADFTYPFMKED